MCFELFFLQKFPSFIFSLLSFWVGTPILHIFMFFVGPHKSLRLFFFILFFFLFLKLVNLIDLSSSWLILFFNARLNLSPSSSSELFIKLLYFLIPSILFVSFYNFYLYIDSLYFVRYYSHIFL